MKSPVFIVPAAVLATATAVAILVAQAGDRSPTLDPGFVPNTGQINSGHAAEPWSDALPQEEPPSQEEARAALMMPDDGTPSAGQGSAGQIPSGQLTTAGTSVSTTTGTAGPPIGATTQTMPANFSQRDLLRCPISRSGRDQWEKKADVRRDRPAGHAEAFNSDAGIQFLLCNTGRSKS